MLIVPVGDLLPVSSGVPSLSKEATPGDVPLIKGDRPAAALAAGRGDLKLP
ncbi:MAG: hypothetical protein GTO55_01075 [Armatimonadetes bacterium]|nr:hypothetical protein [Armatimonadota bacterium]NIM22876.1 hypothetical protein [Armatimonadota bacterium]NIM66742.1 hypothetical protein [Armatimonadota bacterium]NIN04939.1 hypothetical protein [Armatimonadota bacterium]NIO95951.1 hypothetical protein [Armatimonadota bacterium]